MATIPPSCPQCRGSGHLVVLLDKPHGAEELPFWRIHHGLGFLQVPCGLCYGYGTLHREPTPSADPGKWTHRVPPEATGDA